MAKNLTDAEMQQLFGANHSGLIYYNYDLECWNTNTLNNTGIPQQHSDTVRAQVLHQNTTIYPGIRMKNCDLAAVAVMQTEPYFLPEIGRSIQNPTYIRDGKTIVGTLVWRNRSTGELHLPSIGWLVSGSFKFPATAVQESANSFLLLAIQRLRDMCK
ncbi:MAG: hypothetical protein Q4E56_03750 [Pseudomonadota bacterium]|nr:hypothetical protein [Pseudomonadota bacterium]